MVVTGIIKLKKPRKLNIELIALKNAVGKVITATLPSKRLIAPILAIIIKILVNGDINFYFEFKLNLVAS